MLIFDTSRGSPSSETEGLWFYNGLDTMVTLEVLHAIEPQLDEITTPVYDHARALQAPILEMMLRGFRVDPVAGKKTFAALVPKIRKLEEQLLEILVDGIGLPKEMVTWTKKEKGQVQQKFLWNSPARLQHLFYEVMGFPPVKFRGKISVDRKALEKLKNYFFAEPIVNHILAIRDVSKKLGLLKTGVDYDGRMRFSFNIAGTDTGRLSSYKSSFGSGTNMQNITPELRNIFAADPGKKVCYMDLGQAEARGVGAIIWNLFHDGVYLDFCESGDLHTNVTRMTWQSMGWTDDPKANKAIAEQSFYRHFSYRDASKRLGHASNYYGQPPHIAKEVHIPYPLVKEFQEGYFAAFPGIPEWHKWVKQKVIKDGWITTFMGRRRWFFGRRYDSDTHRAAIAYEPQSSIADYINKGILNVWRADIVELLVQVHDAIVFQYDEEKENEVVPAVQRLLEIEVPLMYGRSLVIPTDAMVGWNWAYKTDNNPDGLVKFNGNDQRKRSPEVSFMGGLLS
jgi:DNA polymerase-1